MYSNAQPVASESPRFVNFGPLVANIKVPIAVFEKK